jgi:ABC-type lipoprotein release transport system permease subunit
LEIPANIIGYQLLGINNLADLNPLYALVLILISVGLTLLSGLLPARKAAKQDPVNALRTE